MEESSSFGSNRNIDTKKAKERDEEYRQLNIVEEIKWCGVVC